MPIEIRCQGCSRLLRLPDGSEGKQARCPACSHTFRVVTTPSTPQESPDIPRESPAEDLAAAAFRETENPYQSPRSETYTETARRSGDDVLASRGTRFVGAILDGLIYFGAAIPGGVLMLAFPDDPEPFILGGVAIFVGVLAISVVNWIMITNSGQSIAKRMLSMRIVGASDGQLPGFMRGVVIRNWLRNFINHLCSLFSIVDALWIFGEEKRCLHDLMADTIVVVVRSDETLHDRGSRYS